VNFCVLKHLFLEEVHQPKQLPKNPGNALSDALLTGMSRFQSFASGTAKKENRGFLETASCAGSTTKFINSLTELIWGQTFRKFFFFTGDVFMAVLGNAGV